VACRPSCHDGYAWTPTEFIDHEPGSRSVVLIGL